MYVARVPNRGSPPAILLRESYRVDGKVKNRTLANLSRWPQDKVEALAAVLKGSAEGQPRGPLRDRAQPAARARRRVLGALRNLGARGADRPGPVTIVRTSLS